MRTVKWEQWNENSEMRTVKWEQWKENSEKEEKRRNNEGRGRKSKMEVIKRQGDKERVKEREINRLRDIESLCCFKMDRGIKSRRYYRDR